MTETCKVIGAVDVIRAHAHFAAVAVLHGGHAAGILVERVENPTDKRPASSLCYGVADPASPEANRPVVGPGAFPHTPPRAGARGYFDGTHRSRAEGGTGPRSKTPIPGGHREGDRGGVRVSLPRRTARETITHGRFGIPWAEKWPLIEILLKCRDPDIKAKSSRAARLTKHQAATSSISVGSSSPPPVLLTRRDTGHMQRRPSPAGLRSSVPAAPFSHGPILSLSSTTGIRS